jgi:Skp family chaperone for outer membrane proteins
VSQLAKLVGFLVMGLVFLASIGFSDVSKSSEIATLDQESLYRNSFFGQRVFKDISDQSEVLLANELLLQSQLESEETSLTKKRKTIETDEFKKLAAAFDKKVQKIRAETTESRMKLGEYSEGERNRFFKIILPVLMQLSEELGITTLLDHRMAILSLKDITDAAIKRVDEIIGDGKEAIVN